MGVLLHSIPSCYSASLDAWQYLESVDCHVCGGAVGIPWRKARDAAKHCVMHRVVPMLKLSGSVPGLRNLMLHVHELKSADTFTASLLCSSYFFDVGLFCLHPLRTW